MKVIIPPNVMVPSINTVLPNFEQNEKEIAINLDLADKERENVITRIAAYQQQILSSYNKRVGIWQFQPRNLVIRKAFITISWEGSKKIAPIRESPYKNQPSDLPPFLGPCSRQIKFKDLSSSTNKTSHAKDYQLLCYYCLQAKLIHFSIFNED